MENTSTFIKHLKRFLRPIVKLLLNEGFAYQDFDRVLRETFVEVADEEFKLSNGKKQTASRTAILTGLSRKEVQRVRQLDESAVASSFKENRAAAVVSGWRRDSSFPNDSLPIDGEFSFTSLVKKYSRDMPVRATLDELLRVGAVARIDKNTIKLERDVYVPELSKLSKFNYISQAASELISTGNHNLENSDVDSRMQLSVFSHRLTPETAQRFKSFSNAKNMELLKELDIWLTNNEENEGNGVADKTYAGVGIYYFEDNKKGEINE